ncbi:MAG: hypothetical protein Q4E33_01525 [Erysipelotrichaceae bacterium]|nr:hypothetical protein [Erysipelotrichaceae bacterium]
MEKIKKLFFESEMSYKKVIILAVISGVITGLIMVCPFINNTSIGNIGVCFEMWILLAMYIILNCDKPLEAGIKTFIFFLISQPIVYLVQVPFSDMGWSIFMYYKRWFIITLLTLPGGFVAHYTKKGNILGLLIYSVANFLLMFMEFPAHFNTFISNPPYQILACLFILVISIMFTLLLFDDKKLIIASIVLTILFTIGGFIYNNYSSNNIYVSVDTNLDVATPIEVEESSNEIEVYIDGNNITATAHSYGQFPLTIKDGEGNIIHLQVIIDKKEMSIVLLD